MAATRAKGRKRPARPTLTIQFLDAEQEAPAGLTAPTWCTRPILMQMRGSGMKPQKADKLEVGLPDGTFASLKAAEQYVAWPAVRLRIVFDEYNLWWRSSGTAWHRDAIDAALELAKLVSPTWIVHDTTGRWGEPVLKPTPYSRIEAARYLSKTLFQQRSTNPWVVIRDGERLRVQYERSLLALDGSLEVFLPPTVENAALLERALDDLAGRVSFAWAGVGYGLAGWASMLALVGNASVVSPSTRIVLLPRREQKQPGMGADWLMWLGDRWRRLPAYEKVLEGIGRGLSGQREEHGRRVRFSLPRITSPRDARGAKAAKKLRGEVREAARRINAIAYRALLRRPVPG